MSLPLETQPNIHTVLRAIRELEKLPEVRAYLNLLESLKQPQKEEK